MGQKIDANAEMEQAFKEAHERRQNFGASMQIGKRTEPELPTPAPGKQPVGPELEPPGPSGRPASWGTPGERAMRPALEEALQRKGNVQLQVRPEAIRVALATVLEELVRMGQSQATFMVDVGMPGEPPDRWSAYFTRER